MLEVTGDSFCQDEYDGRRSEALLLVVLNRSREGDDSDSMGPTSTSSSEQVGIATAFKRLREVVRVHPTNDTERQRLPAIGQGSSSSPLRRIDARRVRTAAPRGSSSAPFVSSLKLASGE